MEKMYSDYQIMVLEQAIEKVGQAQDVAAMIECSPAMITRVLKGQRVLAPMTCVNFVKVFTFADIMKMSEVYSPNVIKWIVYKEKDNINT